ncbi:MAG: hypothetical protein V9G19_00835 [Tetrasphaera sp.]
MGRAPVSGWGPAVLVARSRGVGSGVALAGGVIALSWWAASWLASQPQFDGPRARVPVVAAAPLALAMLLAARLGSPDVALDRTSPRAWWRLRLAGVLSWAAVTAVGLGVGLRAEPAAYGAGAVVRNILGYAGLACLAAGVVGAGLAWAPGFVLGSVLYLAAPHPVPPAAAWWAWPMAPGGWDGSWVSATGLFVIGVGWYAARGPRESPAPD